MSLVPPSVIVYKRLRNRNAGKRQREVKSVIINQLRTISLLNVEVKIFM